MKIRSKIAVATTSGLLAAGALAGLAPAVHATGATITLTSAGTLSISEPSGTVSLGTTATKIGAWTSAAFGNVTVTDDRTGLVSVGGLTPNAWTATATLSNFPLTTTAPVGATVAQTSILATSMTYNTNASPTVGTGSTAGSVFTPVATIPVVAAGTPVVVGTMASTGPNSQTWSPTVAVALVNQVAGTYTGTITHSVS